MFLMEIIFLLILFISNFMMLLSLILSKKSYIDREKNSPFECGFNPNSAARIPFSLHFFLITVIFLIFDVEITLILPMILNFKMSNYIYWTITSMIFIFILIAGIYHEWNQNMLNWTN